MANRLSILLCISLAGFLGLSPQSPAQEAGPPSADLPIKPVKFGDKAPVQPKKKSPGSGVTPATPVPPIPVGPPQGEDPRDTPPPVFYGEELDPSDSIIYVLDGSGSMDFGTNQSAFQVYKHRSKAWAFRFEGVTYGKPPLGGHWGHTRKRWDRACFELLKSVNALSPSLRFNVVAYDCNTQSFNNTMVPATEANKKDLAKWVVALYMPINGHGTGTGPATSLALSEKTNKLVVLLTDGQPNCGSDDHRKMIKFNNTQNAVVNVFGISATGPWRAFCQGVAADNRGQFFDIQ